MKRLIGVILLLGIGACAKYTEVYPGYVSVANEGLAVSSNMYWNQSPSAPTKKATLWTADGITLDSMTFYANLEDGDALVKRQDKDQDLPVFRSDMLPNEIAELVEATYVSQQGALFELLNLKPRTFAGESGFEFEYTYTLRGDHLKRRGKAAGAIVDGQLYLILFEAPSLYYYGKYEAEAERIFDSASLR